MSSTYTSLRYHIIFATKNRQPALGKDWRNELHNYLGGIVKGFQEELIEFLEKAGVDYDPCYLA